VKEVLVVQAKKDTSELVKKKEEVTQERIPFLHGSNMI
jgi:5'(3')-deoxyribonucleotidase